MFDLNLEEMCKNTASDKIHIWFPNRPKSTSKKSKDESTQIQSIETDDHELAVVSY